MKLVFDHIDFTIVGHLQGLLEAAGIRSEIRNLNASSAAGAVPVAQVYPELWILENKDESRAKALIQAYRDEAAAAPVGPDWTCPACGEKVDGIFSSCWNCGTAIPAALDPGPA
jgi:hypothetical protein